MIGETTEERDVVFRKASILFGLALFGLELLNQNYQLIIKIPKSKYR